MGDKGRGLPGGGGRAGGGKVNGQLSVVTSVGRKRMGKALQCTEWPRIANG